MSRLISRNSLAVSLFLSLTVAFSAAQTQMASLRLQPELRWQRNSPTQQQMEGPVLYQLVFRFVAHDSTLTGSGGINSPLAISSGGVGTPQLASGAVTFSKLAFGAANNGQVLVADGANGASWQTLTAVSNVTASSPLNVTNGNTTPNITLSGIVGITHGGTGLSSAGIAGNFLRSNGTSWISSSIQPSDLPSLVEHTSTSR